MRPRLIQYELTKLRSARFLWGLFALLLVVNGVLCYLNATPLENVSGMEAVLEAYRADPEALMAYRDELNKKQQEQIPKFIEAQMKGETYEFDLPTTFDQNPDKSARLNDLTLISTMQATVLDMKPAYVGKVTPVIQAAARNKRELIESFGQTETSLACIKQDSIVNTYTARTEDVTFQPELKKGWDQFFGFEPVNLFMLVVILVGVTSLFAAEHSGGAYLLRAYAKGRSHTAAAKLCAVLADKCAEMCYELNAPEGIRSDSYLGSYSVKGSTSENADCSGLPVSFRAASTRYTVKLCAEHAEIVKNARLNALGLATAEERAVSFGSVQRRWVTMLNGCVSELYKTADAETRSAITAYRNNYGSYFDARAALLAIVYKDAPATAAEVLMREMMLEVAGICD